MILANNVPRARAAHANYVNGLHLASRIVDWFMYRLRDNAAAMPLRWDFLVPRRGHPPMKRRFISVLTTGILLGGGLSLLADHARAAPAPMVVHEWGTFTAQQDEQGKAIGAVNVDDEPVPRFVHRLNSNWIVGENRDKPIIWYQGVPAALPAVTLRLETPVLYFYPPDKGGASRFNVEVAFRGGWLSEYYPYAQSTAPGFPENLDATRTGTLSWRDVGLSAAPPTPQTDEHVWLAPRDVAAASVSVGKETEKYIFYRGVGHLEAPVSIERDAKRGMYTIRANGFADLKDRSRMRVNRFWLVDVRADGRVAFKAFGPVRVSELERAGVKLDGAFTTSDYARNNMPDLRADMHATLVTEGLYADEARAMLNTWELSYFKSHGRRLFFTVPRAWTDHVLPISISVPHRLERVMIGRIEIVTPSQRDLLSKISAGADADLRAMTDAYYKSFEDPALKNSPQALDTFIRLSLRRTAELRGFEIPAAYRHYLDLGRFRDALLLDEEQRRPSAALTRFIDQNVYVRGRRRRAAD